MSGRRQRCRPFAADLAPILAAIDDTIAALHQHELDEFHRCHDPEGHAWAGRVDELRAIRDLVQRLPYTPMRTR